jgi:hypothetical protein
MNLNRNQPRLDRLQKECTVSAAPALVLAAALAVLGAFLGLSVMWG